MCDQTEIEYKPGEVVWFKLSNLWWPAEVQDPATLEEDLIQGLRKKPVAVIKFFNEDYYDFVKDIKQIYHYNSSKKWEFIKKGMDQYRARGDTNQMSKFPKDIIKAEELTGGNVNILDDPRLAPEEKINYKEFFTTPKLQKEVKNVKKNKNEVVKSKLLSNSQSSGKPDSGKQYIKEYRIQSVSEPSTVRYNCPDCNFVCSRIILLAHHKSFNKGSGCPKPPVKFGRSILSTLKLEKGSVKRKSVSGNEATPAKKKIKTPAKGPVEEVTKKQVKTPILKEVKEKDKKKLEAMREQLLMDWNEEDAEEAANSSEDVTDPIEIKKDEKPNADNTNKTSCFDFEDNDEDVNIDRSVRFGQKLPRVIPKEDKSKEKAKMRADDDALEEEFNNLMNETIVHVVPGFINPFLSNSSALPGSPGKAETNLGSKANNDVCVEGEKEESETEKCSQDKPKSIESILEGESSKKSEDDNNSLLNALENYSPAEPVLQQDLHGPAKTLNTALYGNVKKIKTDADLLASLRSDSDSNSGPLESIKSKKKFKGSPAVAPLKNSTSSKSPSKSFKKIESDDLLKKAEVSKNETPPKNRTNRRRSGSGKTLQSCDSNSKPDHDKNKSNLVKKDKKSDNSSSAVESAKNSVKSSKERVDEVIKPSKTNFKLGRSPSLKSPSRLKLPSNSSPLISSESKSPPVSSVKMAPLSGKRKRKSENASAKLRHSHVRKELSLALAEWNDPNSDETSNSMVEEKVEKSIAKLLSDLSNPESVDSSRLPNRHSSGKTKSKAALSKVRSKTTKSSLLKSAGGGKSLTNISPDKDVSKSSPKISSATSPVILDSGERNKINSILEFHHTMKERNDKRGIVSPNSSKQGSASEQQHQRCSLRKDSFTNYKTPVSKHLSKQVEEQNRGSKLKQIPNKGGHDYKKETGKTGVEKIVDSRSSKSSKSTTQSKSISTSQSRTKGGIINKAKTLFTSSSTVDPKSQIEDNSDRICNKSETTASKGSPLPSTFSASNKKENSPQTNKAGNVKKKKKKIIFDDPYSDLFKPDIIIVSKPSPKTSSDSTPNSSLKLKLKEEAGSSPKILSSPSTLTYSSQQSKDRSPSKSPKKSDPSKSSTELINISKEQVKTLESSSKSPSTECGSDSPKVSVESKDLKSSEPLSKPSKKNDNSQKSNTTNELRPEKVSDTVDQNNEVAQSKPSETSKGNDEVKSSDKLKEVPISSDNELKDTKNESKRTFNKDCGNLLNLETDSSVSNSNLNGAAAKTEPSLKIEENSNSEFKLLEVLTGEDSSSGKEAKDFDGVLSIGDTDIMGNVSQLAETVKVSENTEVNFEDVALLKPKVSEISTHSIAVKDQVQEELQESPTSLGGKLLEGIKLEKYVNPIMSSGGESLVLREDAYINEDICVKTSEVTDPSKLPCTSTEAAEENLLVHERLLEENSTKTLSSNKTTSSDSPVKVEVSASMENNHCDLIKSNLEIKNEIIVANTFSLNCEISSQDCSSQNISDFEADKVYEESNKSECIVNSNFVSQALINTSNPTVICNTEVSPVKMFSSTKDSIAEEMEEMFSSTDVPMSETKPLFVVGTQSVLDNSLTVHTTATSETEDLKNNSLHFDCVNVQEKQILGVTGKTDKKSKQEEVSNLNWSNCVGHSLTSQERNHELNTGEDLPVKRDSSCSSKRSFSHFPGDQHHVQTETGAADTAEEVLTMSKIHECSSIDQIDVSHRAKPETFTEFKTVSINLATTEVPSSDSNYHGVNLDPLNKDNNTLASQEGTENDISLEMNFDEDSKFYVSEVVISSDSNEKKDEMCIRTKDIVSPSKVCAKSPCKSVASVQNDDNVQPQRVEHSFTPRTKSNDSSATTVLENKDDSIEEEDYMYGFHDEITISDDPSCEVVISSEEQNKATEDDSNLYNFDDQVSGLTSTPPPLAKIKPKNSPFGDLKINLLRSSNVVDLSKDFRAKVMSGDFLTPDKIKEIFQQGGSSTSTSQGASVLQSIVVPPQSLFQEDKLSSSQNSTVSSSIDQSISADDVQRMELDINSMPVVIADAPELVSANVSTAPEESTTEVTASASSTIPQPHSTPKPVKPATSGVTNVQNPEPPVDHYVKLVRPGSVKPKPGSKLRVYNIAPARSVSYPTISKPTPSKVIKYIPQTKSGFNKLSADSLSGKELVIITSSGKKRVIFKSDSFLSSLSGKTLDRNPSKRSLVVTLQNSDASTSGKPKVRSVANLSSRTVELVSSSSLKSDGAKTNPAGPQLKLVSQPHLVSYTGDKKKFFNLQQFPIVSSKSSKISQYKEPEAPKRRLPKLIARKPSIIKSSLRSEPVKGTVSTNQVIFDLLNKNEQQSNETSRLTASTKNMDCVEANLGPRIAPKEDILAKALADTQVFQDSELSEENTSSYVQQFQTMPSTVTRANNISATNDQQNVVSFTIPAASGFIQPSMPLLSEEMSSDKDMSIEESPSLLSMYKLGYNEVVVQTEEKTPTVSQVTCPTRLMADINLAEIELPPDHPPESTANLQDISSIPLPPEPYSPVLHSPKLNVSSSCIPNFTSKSSGSHNIGSLFQKIGDS